MRLYANQFQKHLASGLAKCYLLVGDEPLQLQEACDAVKQAAAAQGFTEREAHQVDANFKWHQLQDAAGNMSLFASKRLIDLHMPTGKPGTAGSKALVAFVQSMPADVMLLIRCDEWTANNDKSKWVKTLTDEGAFMRVFQPKAAELPGWIQNRCQQIGLNADRDAVALLAMRLEGNLLAAAQELEKLKMRFADQTITGKDVAGLVADNARFDVFRLTDALIEGHVLKAIRILRSLKKNDLSPVVIHWALEKECRMLCDLASIRAKSHNVSAQDYRRHGIWQNRQAPIQNCLNRLSLPLLEQQLSGLSRIDKQIKGRASGDAWQGMERWLAAMAA